MRRRSARLPFAALPLFAALALGAAAQEVWTGAGGGKSWNDGANWASGRAPAPTVGLRVLFDAPEGAAFGFGGQNPIRFAQVALSSNSGPVTIKAPGLVFGGSVNAEP